MSEQAQKPSETTSETTSAPAVAAPAPPPSVTPSPSAHRPQRGGTGIAWFAMLMALAAAGAGGYVVINQEQVVAKWRGKQAELGADFKTLSSRLDQHSDQTTGLEQQLSVLAVQIQSADENVQRVLAITGDPGRHWQLVEAEFLLRNAGYRLQLSRDVSGAIAALQDADKQLERHGDPALQPLRQTIAQQIVTLQALALPDIAGMSANLSALLATVDKLAMPSALKGVGHGEVSGDYAGEPAWKATLYKLWDQMKSLVVVRHGEKAEAPLMPPDQHYFLHLNLQLKLEAARLALLQGNEQVWHDSLTQASKWLQTYFDVNSQGVRSAQTTLSQLNQATIQPALPDITASLQLLREYMAKHPGVPAPAPMPSVTPAAPEAPAAAEGDSL